MAINAGVNISKFVGYAVLAPMPGVNVTKALAYAVLAPLPGLNITKALAYAVLDSPDVRPPVWGGWPFPDGTLGVPYDCGWDMPTSAYPVAYSVIAGALPDGLALDALSGNQAHVHGPPTVAGTFYFTLRAENDYGIVDKDFSITIVPASGGGGGSFTFIM